SNVLVIREEGNKRTYHRVDLTRPDLFASDIYYLKQNDVIYVEPNKAKARNSDIGQSTTLILSGTSILISVASLIVNIVR
ncbi:MAG: polysaccharide export protein, partial [Bacteroides sp.]